MKKGLISLVIIAVFAVLLGGCKAEPINDIELSAGLKEFTGEDLEDYANLRFNWGYDFMLEFEDTRMGNYPIRHSVYVWGKDFRNELRDTIILIGNELEKLNKENSYSFSVEFDEKFRLLNDGTEILSLEKSRSTAVLALLLSPSFNANVNKFYNGLTIMSISLETSKATSDFEIVELKANIEKFYTHPMHSGHMEHRFYGFNTVHDIESFLKGTYLEKSGRVNTGGDCEIKLNEPVVFDIHKGQYFWFNFKAPVAGEYVFFTNGDVDTKLELGESIAFGSVKQDDNSGIDGNASISYELNKDEVIYIKVMGANVSDWGMSVLKVEAPYKYLE